MSIERTIIEALRSRPRMYLPDDRFNTLVAFLDGYDMASGQRSLVEFNRWLQDRTYGYVTNYHWRVIVAAIVLGIEPSEGWRESIDKGFDGRAARELLNQLAEFTRLNEDL